MKSKNGDDKMSDLLQYKIEKSLGEGFIARCIINPKISVFSIENDESLKKGIHSAAKLYALTHPNNENESIREDSFTMQLVE